MALKLGARYVCKMGSLFGGAPKPPAPTPPPTMPDPMSPEAMEARKKALAQTMAGGRSSTVLTSPLAAGSPGGGTKLGGA